MKERIKFIAAAIIYGTIGTFLRFVELQSEAVALYRGVIGAIFILLYLYACKKRPDISAIRKNLFWLLLSGVGLGLNWIFLFAAYVNTTVAIASLCNYMAPIFVIILTPLVLKEKLDMRKIPCILAALIGIVMVSGVIEGGIVGPLGVAFGLAGACCFTGIVFCNRKLHDISSFDRALVQLAVSAVAVLPYVLIKNGGLPLPDLKSGMIVILLGVLHTGAAYCLYFSGMAKLPVQSVAILGYIEPVVSVLCSVVFLREPLGWYGWIGAALIIAAAAISEAIPPKTLRKAENN
ncbi:MAG: DMT family transporter [Clostridia bacterium]|nr:DMT family transporter [Clostridia bacterium]